jgi:hypothetical protein
MYVNISRPSSRAFRRLFKRTTAIVGLALVMLGCGPSRDAWVKENNSLIDKVAVYPGARERTPRVTGADTGGLLGRTTGYETSAIFRAPRGTTWSEFAQYITPRLPAAWNCSRAGATSMHCVAGKAFISIIFFATPIPPIYQITADKGFTDDQSAGN